MPTHHSKKRPRSHDSRDRRVSPYSLLAKLPISDSLEARHATSTGITRRQQRKLDRKNRRKRKSGVHPSGQHESEPASDARDVNPASTASRSKEAPSTDLQLGSTTSRKRRKPNGATETRTKKETLGPSTGDKPPATTMKQDTTPSHEDPDSREVRRLERLLGIGKRKTSSRNSSTYDGIFDEAEGDLLELVKACDQTLMGGADAVPSNQAEEGSTVEGDEDGPEPQLEIGHTASSARGLPSDEEDNSSESKHIHAGSLVVSSNESEEDVPYVAKWKRGRANHDTGRTASSRFSMKALQGLLNRVSVSNTADIASKISSLYPNDLSTAEPRKAASSYVDAVLDAINQGNTMGSTNPYLRAHVEVVFILGTTVDMTLLANFVTTTIKRLTACFESDTESTFLDDSLRSSHILGYVVALCTVYDMGALSSGFMYETLKWVAEPLCKTRLDAELKFLQEAGPLLRKTDPVAFADVVKFVHRQTNQQGASGDAKSSSNELSYKLSMLADTVENIRNNRIKVVKRISQSVERSSTHLPFRASVMQLLDDTFTSTRWWENTMQNESTGVDTHMGHQRTSAGASFDEPNMSKLAAALRLHTDSRRSLLAAVMNSTSCADAIQRIDRLGVFSSKQKLKDLTYIITQSCMAEQPYNKFYALLAKRVCEKSREARFAMEFTIQDAFKGSSGDDNEGSLSRKVKKLARYLGDLWSSEGLPLSMMRRIPDLEDVSVGEQRFYTASFERMISQRKAANVDPLAPFSRLKQEAVTGGKVFCSFLAVFLRRHVHAKMSGKDRQAVSRAISQLEK